MPANVVMLWVVGLVCLLAAAIGETVKLGGWELPALTSRKTRIPVALIGVVALVLGLVAVVHSSSGSTPGGAATGPVISSPPQHDDPPPADPTTSEPASPSPSRPPSPAPSRSRAPESTPPPAGPADSTPLPPPVIGVHWRGSVQLNGETRGDGTDMTTGWFLDSVPPSRAPLGDLGLAGSNAVAGNALARWSGNGAPSARQCGDLLNTQVGQRQLDVQEGATGCLRTEGGRVASFTVTAAPGALQMTLAVVVWQRA
ncbi:hypothetical protein ACFRAO_36095 [Streptomyces sp. NPDC056656]|uniref:hypothetical protein n=1 Tax=Streptomyces sp. NPDC056656 TaxID=3345895 RepID=UPI003695773C